MATRARSSALVVALGLVAILIGGPLFALTMAAIGVACWREFLAMTRRVVPAIEVGVTGSGAIVLFSASGLFGWPPPVVAGLAFLATLAPLVGQFRNLGDDRALAAWGIGAGGALYVGIAILAAASLRQESGSAAPWLRELTSATSLGWAPAAFGCAWIAVAVLCTWLNDTGAYLVGRSFGRRPLTRLSPKKTVEGSAGGLIGAALAGGICWVAFGLDGSAVVGALVGLLIGVAGQFGDLAESFIKRQTGVKDSGAFIPGHGGVFDRVDALLVAFPTAWVLSAVVAALSP